MAKDLNLKDATITTIVAIVVATALAFFSSFFVKQPEPMIMDIFPLHTNILEYFSIVIGGILAVLLIESIQSREIYDEREIGLALAILSILTPLTLGLGIFFEVPSHIAIALTVAFEMSIFFIFAISFERVVKIFS